MSLRNIPTFFYDVDFDAGKYVLQTLSIYEDDVFESFVERYTDMLDHVQDLLACKTRQHSDDLISGFRMTYRMTTLIENALIICKKSRAHLANASRELTEEGRQIVERNKRREENSQLLAILLELERIQDLFREFQNRIDAKEYLDVIDMYIAHFQSRTNAVPGIDLATRIMDEIEMQIREVRQTLETQLWGQCQSLDLPKFEQSIIGLGKLGCIQGLGLQISETFLESIGVQGAERDRVKRLKTLCRTIEKRMGDHVQMWKCTNANGLNDMKDPNCPSFFHLVEGMVVEQASRIFSEPAPLSAVCGVKTILDEHAHHMETRFGWNVAPLRIGMDDEFWKYFQAFHLERMKALGVLLENEEWAVSDVSTELVTEKWIAKLEHDIGTRPCSESFAFAADGDPRAGTIPGVAVILFGWLAQYCYLVHIWKAHKIEIIKAFIDLVEFFFFVASKFFLKDQCKTSPNIQVFFARLETKFGQGYLSRFMSPHPDGPARYLLPQLNSRVVLEGKECLCGLSVRVYGLVQSSNALVRFAIQLWPFLDLGSPIQNELEEFYHKVLIDIAATNFSGLVCQTVYEDYFELETTLSLGIAKSNWKSRSRTIPTLPNPHIRDTISELTAFNSLLSGPGTDGYSAVPDSIRCMLWRIIGRKTMDSLLEGYSRIKRCSEHGRAMMRLDFEEISVAITSISGTKAVGTEQVENYIRSRYLNKQELESWTAAGRFLYKPIQLARLLKSVRTTKPLFPDPPYA